MNSLLDRSDTTQSVLSKLRHDIILYKFQDMQQVKELELSEAYHCSRSSIRSALVILEKEGLIRSYQNGTKAVCCMSKDDIIHLYDLREYIEQTAVKQIIQAKSSNLESITNAISEINHCPNNVASQLDADMKFHTHIITASNNKAILQAWINIASVLRDVFSLNMTESTQYTQWFIETFQERHLELARILLSGRDEAVDAFQLHIQEARNTSISAILKIGGSW